MKFSKKYSLDYPNQCYDSYENKAYDFGEHQPVGKCLEITCYENYGMQIEQ